jgi:ribosome silencing factor RsfS/YbeB/iojap
MSELDRISKAQAIATAALDRKAENVIALDTREVVSFADTFIFATGRSDRQVRAIADGVRETLREHGEKPIGVEGYHEGRWVLIDVGDVIVHIFQPDVRAHYDLERLWNEAGRIEIESSPVKIAQP